MVLDLPVAEVEETLGLVRLDTEDNAQGRRLRPLEKQALRQSLQNAARYLGRPPREGTAPIAQGQPPTALVGEPASSRKRKMSNIIDQALEAEIEMIPEPQIREMFRRYTDTYGGLPHPQEEPTPEQLPALKDKIDKDTAPYADFGVCGPYIWSETTEALEVQCAGLCG
eukprot:5616882-Amphidinium_carterae.1